MNNMLKIRHDTTLGNTTRTRRGNESCIKLYKCHHINHLLTTYMNYSGIINLSSKSFPCIDSWIFGITVLLTAIWWHSHHERWDGWSVELQGVCGA